jgi:hypothetical protein
MDPVRGGDLVRALIRVRKAAQNLLVVTCLAMAACVPTPHPITAAPSIADAKTAQHVCLDYAQRIVSASSLAAAIGTAAPRQAAFDRCLAAYGWAD